MVGELNDQQIDHVLTAQIIGRIGCTAKNKMYILPITYVYHKGYVYAHSKEGAKISTMRKNPNVCFQVDQIESMTNWRSVIVQGVYEELTSPKQQMEAQKLLQNRLIPFSLSETVQPRDYKSMRPQMAEKELRTVAYRIKVVEKTGRFEKK
jgi:uncharacterized protein